MSSLSSFNYENVGDTYAEILAHYNMHDCSYAQRKLNEFKEAMKQAEHLNKDPTDFEKQAVIERHIQAIREFLDSKGSSCAVMGGRSKRSRRVKKSKRAKRTRRTRR